jgi:hypothetical protein
MQKTAVFWIRDGVLIDRMHVNSVAFAVAAIRYADVTDNISLASLINFAFEKSGISCTDKMVAFNKERFSLVKNIDGATEFYNMLTTNATTYCTYFNGICEFIKSLNQSGILNFITSAVDQPILDEWADSAQGLQLAPQLTELLGRRPNFNKGKDHFSYVHKHYGVKKIFYVADATAEIQCGAQYSQEFNIVPIGFAHSINSKKISQAYNLIIAILHKELAPNHERQVLLTLEETNLSLPDEQTLKLMLYNAHAADVIGGSSDKIINNLVQYFETHKLLDT